jgi:hypothetical protein
MRWYADPENSLRPTTKIEKDTRAWRAIADRILALWDEKLIGDHRFGMITTEMLEAFNDWLRANGHKEWSKETFGPRFAQHVETLRHGVVETRPPATSDAGSIRLARKAGVRAANAINGHPMLGS